MVLVSIVRAATTIAVQSLWIILIFLSSITATFAEDVDVENLAKPERHVLAGCLSDTLQVAKKHELGPWLGRLLQSACAYEIERVQAAAKRELTDETMKRVIADHLPYFMLEKAEQLYRDKPVSSCSGTGCALGEYRTCLMREMPRAIKARIKPSDFEKASQERCEESESAARGALSNDLDSVLNHHFAGGLDHSVNDVIRGIIIDVRRRVVVLYAEDLVRVQPGRKSCKPQMCGASPCISLAENEPTEYECVISQ